MSSNDYVKFLTEQIVGYMSGSKEERKENREPFLFRWFGLLPMAVMYSIKKRKK